MGQVRLLVQGVTKDVDAFTRLMQGEVEKLEKSEPGTLLMEIFVGASGYVVVQETYADADAFLEHSQSVMTSDRLSEFVETFEVKRMTFLTEIDDERVATIASQFNAIQVSQVAGFDR